MYFQQYLASLKRECPASVELDLNNLCSLEGIWGCVVKGTCPVSNCRVPLVSVLCRDEDRSEVKSLGEMIIFLECY